MNWKNLMPRGKKWQRTEVADMTPPAKLSCIAFALLLPGHAVVKQSCG